MKWEAEICRTGNNDMLCFGTADMDFPSAKPILQSIHEVVDRGHLGYPFPKESYYQTIIDWMKRSNGWDIKKEWISNNVGIWSASWNIFDALTERGDEIIYQSPAHFCFETVIRESGRVPVVNPLSQKDGRYTMDFDALRSCFTDKTGAF